MNRETRKSIKFYISLILGYSLLIMGALLPPIGIISNSVLIGGGMILCISAGCIGIDLADIIHQFVLLKANKYEEIKKDIIETKD